MTGSLQVIGAEQLRSDIEAAASDLVQLEDAGERAGDLLEARAETKAPRDTEHLASQHGHTVKAGQVTVFNTARYAKAVHARQPWLTSTLDDLTNEVVDIYDTDVTEIVDNIRGA